MTNGITTIQGIARSAPRAGVITELIQVNLDSLQGGGTPIAPE
jgi:hypothetical protein